MDVFVDWGVEIVVVGMSDGEGVDVVVEVEIVEDVEDVEIVDDI